MAASGRDRNAPLNWKWAIPVIILSMVAHSYVAQLYNDLKLSGRGRAIKVQKWAWFDQTSTGACVQETSWFKTSGDETGEDYE